MRRLRTARLLVALVMLLVGLQVVPASAVDTRTITVTDGYGNPIAGATVSATDFFSGSFEGATGADGTVAIPAAYMVTSVSKSGYTAEQWPQSDTIVLLAPCTFTGRVVDAGGTPVVDAEVSTSYDYALTTRLFSATTGADGSFTLEAGAAPVRIWVSSPGSDLENGFFDQSTGTVGGIGTTLNPAVGATLALGDMEVGGTAYLTGRVFDEGGVIAWDVPGAIGVTAYAYDAAASEWQPFMYWRAVDGASIGDSFAGLWGLGVGTYRFAYTAYLWEEGADEPTQGEVFATTAGSSVATVEAASSFTVAEGQTLGLNFTVPAGAPATVIDTPVAGDDRIGTAIKASQIAFPDGLDSYWGTQSVVIATAYNWPDALGGSTLAGFCGGPLLLVGANAVPETVLTEITRLGATNAYIVGGTGAVGTAVESALKVKLGASNVVRVFGNDRYATANAIAQKIVELTDDPESPVYPREQVWDEETSSMGTLAFVATGGNFPDALAASPIAAGQRVPIFLAGPGGLSTATLAAMDDYGVTDVAILGGTGVVPPAVETALNAKYTDRRVTRIGGVNRYDTAVRIAEWATAGAGFSYPPKWSGLAMATGDNFPDALAGGVLQGVRGSVMLLTTPTTLDSYAGAALVKHKYEIPEVAFLGGTGAVSDAVRTAALNALK